LLRVEDKRESGPERNASFHFYLTGVLLLTYYIY